MKTVKMIVVGGLIFLAFGCAHTHTRGSVVLKHAGNEADVCIGDKEVKVGDKVTFFESKCTGSRGGHGNGHSSERTCTKSKLGEGEVVRTIDEHFSTVKLNSDFKVDEGTIVEKQ